uniref:Dipeptidylpeptidase IV N-terminal domain-containing protein n=1 Tax=Manihot esculenta TaxID=3983 RepID=A0A2C9U2I3_MANES
MVLTLLLHFFLAVSSASPIHESSGTTSIVFATHGSRSHYAFDVFTLLIRPSPSSADELQLTDGQSYNFNGHFPSSSSSLLSLLPNQTPIKSFDQKNLSLVYVTERGGSSKIFYDVVYLDSPPSSIVRSALAISKRVQLPLLKGETEIAVKDKPTVTGDYLIYVSTHEDPGKPRASWAAVYSTELKKGLTRRLTPQGISDFSPAVSPSGVYTAVASYGESGWNGEAQELSTDIYVFLTRDGTQRVKIVEHGGWPSWVDDSTLYFHKRSDDQWISIYRAILPNGTLISNDSVIVERVTPPGLHAFTPATSPYNNKFIAVATRRPGSDYRHFIELTRLVSPQSHHFNPFISPDSTRVGYHRCRGASNDKNSTHLLLENLNTTLPGISLFRVDGLLPSVSPSGDRIAYVDFPGIYVVNRDGSNLRQVYPDIAFSTIWDPVRPGIIYASAGPFLANASTEVDIISINVDGDAKKAYNLKKLTTNGKNNAFPSVSPDGKWIVFRSGQSGYKNLYIMDAVKGEKAALRRLTDGPWTDTMSNWSPDGEWIAFTSTREKPGAGIYELYMIHPNGTGLRRLVPSGLGGRSTHPYFSPDGKTIVFTSDHAGISAEPISYPDNLNAYGEIYTRLTHNPFDDGTPVYSPTYFKAEDLEWKVNRPDCSFKDCDWLNGKPSSKSLVRALQTSGPQCGGVLG